MGDDAMGAVRAEFFHDFDQRWRVELQDADGEGLESIELSAEVDGIRAALRLTREKLRTRGLDIEELAPVDEAHDTWLARVVALAPAN